MDHWVVDTGAGPVLERREVEAQKQKGRSGRRTGQKRSERERVARLFKLRTLRFNLVAVWEGDYHRQASTDLP